MKKTIVLLIASLTFFLVSNEALANGEALFSTETVANVSEVKASANIQGVSITSMETGVSGNDDKVTIISQENGTNNCAVTSGSGTDDITVTCDLGINDDDSGSTQELATVLNLESKFSASGGDETVVGADTANLSGGINPVAQVVTFTPNKGADNSDIKYNIRINNNNYVYTTSASETIKQIVEALQPIVNSDTSVSCTEDDTKITCTAVSAGTLFLYDSGAGSVYDFVIRIDTNKIEIDDKTKFKIPVNSGLTYNYNVDCNSDGIDEVTGATGEYECDYGSSSAGIYTIRIKDNAGNKTGFPQIYFDGNLYSSAVLNIEQWGNGLWTSMNGAFKGCLNLMIDDSAGAPDLTNVTDLSGMFEGAKSLESLGTTNWDTSTITNMYNIFSGDLKFNHDISYWDVSKVTNFYGAFQGNSLFNQNLNTWDTSKVTNMSYMFNDALTFNGDISNWNTSAVTSMNSMFKNASKFNRSLATSGAIWDTSNVTDMSSMFHDASDFNQDISSWDVSNVTNMSNMFHGAKKFNFDLNIWNISSVTDISSMFSDAEKFDGNVNDWNTANIVNMSSVFDGASVFDNNLNNWDTSKVTNMSNMFHSAVKFNKSLATSSSKWDVSNVTDMSSMFNNAIKFNQDLDTWNVENVQNMSNMFHDAQAFDRDISNWSTSSVTNMSHMFHGAINFNIDVDTDSTNWITANVTNMSSMFEGAVLFNQDLSNWDTSKVTDMNSMFLNAVLFDQNLSNWNVYNVTDMQNMFNGVLLSLNNYDAILNSWDNQTLQNNVTFDVGNSKYCAYIAKNDIVNAHNWNIADGGVYEDCPPVITSNGGGNNAYITVAEHQKNVTVVSAVDANEEATYKTIVSGPDRNLFELEYLYGDLKFKEMPDFENPKDSNRDNVYEIQIQAADSSDNKDIQTLFITVTDIANEFPEIISNNGEEDVDIELYENVTHVTTVQALDPNIEDNITYLITGGADKNLFSIDLYTGNLVFKNPPDFENPLDSNKNNRYEVQVSATDGSLSDFQNLYIDIKSLSEELYVYTPIYRLYNKRTGAQLYTRGKTDRDKILDKYKDFEFTDGMPAFYARLTISN